MKLKIAIALALVSCTHAELPSSSDPRLAARIGRASTHNPCTPELPVTSNCLDDQGLVWSICAWNACGIDEQCRKIYQNHQVAQNCGEPEWPACSIDSH